MLPATSVPSDLRTLKFSAVTVAGSTGLVNTNLTFPPATDAVLVSSISTARAFTSVISTSVLTGKTVIDHAEVSEIDYCKEFIYHGWI